MAEAKKKRDGREASYKKKLELMSIELKVYRDIGGLAAKGASRPRILARLMDFAIKALGADCGALYLADRTGGRLAKEASSGALPARRAAQAARAAEQDAKPFTDGPKRDGSKGALHVLAVPIKRKRKVIGVITVFKKTARGPFSSAEVRTMASLSRNFSIIMERAELVSELDVRLERLSTLNKVGNLLISTLDQTVIRHRAMEAITRLMRAETGSLLLIDKKSNELYFEVALGEKGKKLKEVRLSIGEGIAGWVAKHGKPLVIHDVTKDERFQGSVDKRSRFKTRDMVCVPLRIKGTTIGVLQAINRTEGSFTTGDLKLFQMFSNQVAIALDNARLYEEMLKTFYATSGALAEAIEKRDPYTGGHTRRVLGYCMAAARYLKMEPREMEVLKLSAMLHDIGKIGIEDRVLKKEAPLNSAEAASMQMHPQYGAEILKHIPQLKEIVPGMLYHHERVDGLGYPGKLKKEKIPLVARIIAVADAYDAMTTTRPYRDGLSDKTAIAELQRCSGMQFDAKVVAAFIEAHRNGEIDGIRHRELPEIMQRTESFLRL